MRSCNRHGELKRNRVTGTLIREWRPPIAIQTYGFHNPIGAIRRNCTAWFANVCRRMAFGTPSLAAPPARHFPA